LGFYYELIETINHFTEDIKKSLRFLIPLALGMVTGLVAFASLIHFLLTNYSLPTMCFFIGLIVGIIPLIYEKVREPNQKKQRNWFLVLFPILLLVFISNVKGVTVTNPEEVVAGITVPYMIFLFFSGVVAAAALVIPGISGSFVLLLIGIYPIATYSVSNIPVWLRDISNTALLIDMGKVLVPLGLGVVVGGLSMARLIEKLLLNYHAVIYSIILGLLLGSVYALFREPIVYQSGISTAFIIMAAVTFICGGFASYNIGKKRL
jgi:putative membrane protein